MQKADQFGSFADPLSVDRNSLSLVLSKVHIHLIVQILLDHDHADMSFLLSEPDQISVPYTSV